jgi:hypothetical protein
MVDIITSGIAKVPNNSESQLPPHSLTVGFPDVCNIYQHAGSHYDRPESKLVQKAK